MMMLFNGGAGQGSKGGAQDSTKTVKPDYQLP
jgi:hypothetical protein